MLLDSSLDLDTKINAVEAVQAWDVPKVTENFEMLWSALSVREMPTILTIFDIYSRIFFIQQPILDVMAPMPLRLAALQASASLISVCTNQDMLTPFFTTFSLNVRSFRPSTINPIALTVSSISRCTHRPRRSTRRPSNDSRRPSTALPFRRPAHAISWSC